LTAENNKTLQNDIDAVLQRFPFKDMFIVSTSEGFEKGRSFSSSMISSDFFI